MFSSWAVLLPMGPVSSQKCRPKHVGQFVAYVPPSKWGTSPGNEILVPVLAGGDFSKIVGPLVHMILLEEKATSFVPVISPHKSVWGDLVLVREFLFPTSTFLCRSDLGFLWGTTNLGQKRSWSWCSVKGHQHGSQTSLLWAWRPMLSERWNVSLKWLRGSL